jgi:hypothetical protein
MYSTPAKKISTEELVLIQFLRRNVWLDELAYIFGRWWLQAGIYGFFGGKKIFSRHNTILQVLHRN